MAAELINLTDGEAITRRIHKTQNSLWAIQSELKTYSFLFTSLGTTEIKDGDLYGVGIRLVKLSSKSVRTSC